MTPEMTLKEYVRAANAHDLDASLALVAEDAVYLFSNETHHVGKEAIKAAIAKNFETIRHESYGIRAMRWLACSPDIAVCVYEFHWSGEIDDQKISGAGRGTSVLRHEANGWKIIHEHLSKGSLGG